MQPGERINLIKRVAHRLAERDWGEVDLILRQFGLPTTDDWRGDVRSYAMWMLDQGNDTSLVGLDEYLSSDDDAAEQPRNTATLAEAPLEPFRLFLSHLHEHQAFMALVATALEAHGVSAFVAHISIEPTEEWEQVIRSELRRCDALAAYLTTGFGDSKWTDQEVGWALGRETMVVAVKVDLNPYGFLGRFQAVQGAGKDAPTLAAELAERLRGHSKTKQRMAEATVEVWATSQSFNAARAAYSHMKAIPEILWTARMRERVEKAAIENVDISQCWWGSSNMADDARRFLAHLDLSESA